MRKILILIVSILLLIGFIGFTYVMYNEFVNNEDKLVITVDYDNDANSSVYSLEDTKPVPNEEGMQVNSFDFSITNVSDGLGAYRVVILNDPAIDESLMIDRDYIMVSFQQNNGGYSQPMSLSDIGEGFYIVNNQFLDASNTANFNIKLWVSEAANINLSGKLFQALITVDNIELEEGKFLDTTKPTITLNGEEKVTVIKGESFTDLGVGGISDSRDTLTVDDVITTYYSCNNTECMEIDNINIGEVGTYMIKYMVVDRSFNYNSVYRTVNIIE